MDALKLKGHYIVAREVSLTYVEVSQKYIMPGVNTVDRLHVTGLSTDPTLSKANEIGHYASKAASEIRELAEMVGKFFPIAVPKLISVMAILAKKQA